MYNNMWIPNLDQCETESPNFWIDICPNFTHGTKSDAKIPTADSWMCLCNAHEELLYTKYGDCPTKREKKGCPILGTILEERGTSIEIISRIPDAG